MINFEVELETMICRKNLMNSYKLYFLKAILVNASRDRRMFDFYELACWMCAYSFSDVCALKHRIRPLDKLYDVAVMVVEEEDLMESSKVSEVLNAIQYTSDKGIRKKILALCNYVPYRLLAYLWPEELKGKTDFQKNQLIEAYSRSDERNMYVIFTGADNQKSLTIKPEWANYITQNRTRLVSWIDKKIQGFVWKEM